MYVTAGADMAEQVLVNRDRTFANGPAWSHFIGPFFHRGIMLLDFDEHLHHRRILQHAFTNDALRRYHAVMAPHIRRNLAEWATASPQPVRMHHQFKELTLDLALETFVGVDLSPRGAGAGQQGVHRGRARRHLDHPQAGARRPWARGLKARAFLEDFFRSHLPAKRRDGGDDLFAQLCRARSEDGARVQRRRHRQPHDLPADGRARHHHDHDELDGLPPGQAPGVAGEGARAESMAAGDLDYDGVLGLEVLDRVMKESMRLCSPVPSLPRVAVRDTSDRRLPHPGRRVRHRVAVHEPLPARALARPDPLRPRPVRARPA